MRAGIIGLGVGQRHLKHLLQHPKCEISLLCDKSPARRAELAQKYPQYHTVADANEALTNPEIDLVIIASFDADHATHIVTALQNNKHVYVEKPLCRTEKDLQKITKLLKKNPHLKLSAHLPLRAKPRFKDLKMRLDAGELGTLSHVEGDYWFGRWERITSGWRGQDPDYSVIHGAGVHMVDLLMHLTGQRIKEVYVVGNNQIAQRDNLSFNDCVTTLLTFNNGLTGKVSAIFGSTIPHFHNVVIHGSRGTWSNGLPVEPNKSPGESAYLFTSSDKNVPPQTIQASYYQKDHAASAEILHSFIDSILNNTPPLVTAQEVINVTHVCLALEKSLATRKAVKITKF